MDNQQNKKYWEDILTKEGLSPIKNIGTNPLGDGLGDVNTETDKMEEENTGHGSMCPINLGHSINDGLHIDQPNERPVEEEVFNN
ncbi:MAG: hypothetical protein PHE21_01905 [Candidatus Dojkabacteria bacterium]|nr:hypothetical protein [Candidatus Dojkabacteria bacterium]